MPGQVFEANCGWQESNFERLVIKSEYEPMSYNVCNLKLIFVFQVLQVRAVDGDRGLNTPLIYSIVDGPPGDIFAIR